MCASETSSVHSVCWAVIINIKPLPKRINPQLKKDTINVQEQTELGEMHKYPIVTIFLNPLLTVFHSVNNE